MLVKLAAIGAPAVRLAAEKVQVPPPSSSRRSTAAGVTVRSD